MPDPVAEFVSASVYLPLWPMNAIGWNVFGAAESGGWPGPSRQQMNLHKNIFFIESMPEGALIDYQTAVTGELDLAQAATRGTPSPRTTRHGRGRPAAGRRRALRRLATALLRHGRHGERRHAEIDMTPYPAPGMPAQPRPCRMTAIGHGSSASAAFAAEKYERRPNRQKKPNKNNNLGLF